MKWYFSMKKRKLKFILFGAVMCIVAYVLITTVSICIYAGKDEKCKADVAIILGAGAADEGVSPVYRERINHGIWLYENGYVEALIVTGGIGDGNSKTDAYIAKEYAIEQGIPEKDIYMEEQSKITQENIMYSKKIMQSCSFDTAIVVSDPLHMKRAMLMAEDYGIAAYSSPTPTSMYRSMKTRIPFLCREEFFYIGYRFYRLVC